MSREKLHEILDTLIWHSTDNFEYFSHHFGDWTWAKMCEHAQSFDATDSVYEAEELLDDDFPKGE